MHPILERLDETLNVRGYCPNTVKAYFAQTRAFLRYTGKTDKTVKKIDDLDHEAVRRYMVHLKLERNLAPSTINQALSGIHFFYRDVLGKEWDCRALRAPKRRRKLPVVLSPQEIQRILDATEDFKHRTIFMTLYSAGLRLSEGTHLTAADIDSRQMRIHIRNGKGQKERYTILSQTLVETLRSYWKVYRPKRFLFFGASKDVAIHKRTVQRRFAEARDRAGVKAAASPHSLRHAFATRLLRAGQPVKAIADLLGHRSLAAVAIYAKVDHARLLEVAVEWPEVAS